MVQFLADDRGIFNAGCLPGLATIKNPTSDRGAGFLLLQSSPRLAQYILRRRRPVSWKPFTGIKEKELAAIATRNDVIQAARYLQSRFHSHAPFQTWMIADVQAILGAVVGYSEFSSQE